MVLPEPATDCRLGLLARGGEFGNESSLLVGQVREALVGEDAPEHVGRHSSRVGGTSGLVELHRTVLEREHRTGRIRRAESDRDGSPVGEADDIATCACAGTAELDDLVQSEEPVSQLLDRLAREALHRPLGDHLDHVTAVEARLVLSNSVHAQ